MNATPMQPMPSVLDDREELARLLPEPAERDLPSGRHQRLEEFVMSQIHQDLRSAERAPRRPRGTLPRGVRSRGVRSLLLPAALAAAVVTAAVGMVITTGGQESPERRPVAPVTPGAITLSARQVLLAAASTAERTPEGSGAYWYVRLEFSDGDGSAPTVTETWTRRDGRSWFRGAKTGGKVTQTAIPARFWLGGSQVGFERLQSLPDEPKALKSWIATAVERSEARTSAGRPDAWFRARFVFDGLVSLVSELPAPPKVRAAAFRAIASYPDVRSVGAVKGGQGLEYAPKPPPAGPQESAGPQDAEDQAEWERDRALRDEVAARTGGIKPDVTMIVIDPATSRVRNTNFLVTADGAEMTIPGGATITAEWTNRLPG